MICKVIPIKQSRGIKDCWEYITDENKVISIEKKDGSLRKTTINTSLLEMTAEEYMMGKMDFHTVLAYMKNDEKTHRTENVQEKFISGYLCNPETAVQEFLDVKEQNLFKQNKTLNDETGNYAYHIIQSFPEDLDITDDEVHQCGRELCEKLHAYQAVICSHVHPVIDEEGEVTGKCKHNHILINSHIHPSMLDPEKPNVFKYNNNRASYAQLQKWNDEIALEHGLPIIRDPETEKKYSWLKSTEENKGSSWTKQVAIDIKNTMRFCSNWEEFKTQMQEQGYHIRETEKNVTYYTPEHTETHKQQIREKRLGREYTKSELERYWTTVAQAKSEMAASENKTSQAPLIEGLVDQYNGDVFVEVMCQNKYNAYYLDIPLKNKRRDLTANTLNTYFEADKTYFLSTSDHNPIAEVTGQDIFDYYEELRKRKENSKQQEETTPDQKRYYYDNTKFNSQTNKPYRISLWDNTGRQRTTIELMCILAMVIIKKEHAPQNPVTAYKFQNGEGDMVYAKTDWKLQNMYNTMVMAREMKLENTADINKKLDRTGKEVARKQKQLRSLTEQYNKMKTINENIDRYESVKDICENLYNMPEGPEKEKALEVHAAELEQYTAAKRYLHIKNINPDDKEKYEKAKNDFKTRFASISEHLDEVQEESKSINEEYRKLKRVDYNLSMAQNNLYCYGPEHASLSRQAKEQTEKEENINID